jgi:glutaredoxin
MDVTLYSRPGCHLCDDARTMLLRVRADIEFALTEVDITTDDALHKRYLERIPVICVDGEERLDLLFTEDELRAALGASSV